MLKDPLTLAVLIAAITALAFWLDYRFTAMSKAGATLLVIIFGALLSNTGIVVLDSPVYSAIEGPVTSLAIVFLLLSVGLGDLKQAGPRMLGMVLIAAIGTALGAFIGALLFDVSRNFCKVSSNTKDRSGRLESRKRNGH